ncbi:hypothetical protein EA58_16565 [Photobacterium galatheae]|uniref:Uncharacterized protein n=1 Tax=Photobacterium galatheae TaxID=1654360 RepID=A0A066RN38_9GAMM|nr:hypothetical protein EA58_16565 [Photobacterium galatheae]
MSLYPPQVKAEGDFYFWAVLAGQLKDNDADYIKFFWWNYEFHPLKSQPMFHLEMDSTTLRCIVADMSLVQLVDSFRIDVRLTCA